MMMKYKDLQFLNNPSQLEIRSSNLISTLPLLSKGSAVNCVTDMPTKVKAVGRVYGDEGEEWCSRMKHYLPDRKSGWLFTPSAPPMKAFLEAFTFRRESTTDEICYTAEFIEDCNGKSFEAKEGFTFARQGENAFDIAYRCSVGVDGLEELNGFPDPFGFSENDRVRIR